MVLQGDPAIAVNIPSSPEYLVTNADVWFEPALVSAQIDSFTVNVELTNLGSVVTDSFTVLVERLFPDGSFEEVATKRFSTTAYKDTVSLKVFTDPLNGFGANEITVTIDNDNDVVEICEDNNVAVVDLFVSSDNIVPIFPCDYAIMNTTDITLIASTASPLLDQTDYLFQMDTTELFDSPILNQFIGTSTGGIVEWPVGTNFLFENFEANVFYWRVSKAPSSPSDSLIWRNSSFIYEPNETMGWNQSHYFQYKRGTKSNDMMLNENTRHYEYQNNVKNITSTAGIVGGNADITFNDIYTSLNNIREIDWSCVGGCPQYAGGVQIAVFNPATILPQQSLINDVDLTSLNTPNCFDSPPCCDDNALGLYGNIHCGAEDVNAFDFHTDNPIGLQRIADFMDQVPDGYYVLVKSIENHNLEQNASYYSFLDAIYDQFDDLNAPQIRNIQNNIPFLVLGRKNVSTFNTIVDIANSSDELLELDIDINGNWIEGKYESVQIGPAQEWHEMHFSDYSLDPSSTNVDNLKVNVYGVRINNQIDFLFSTSNPDTSLANVNASFHPKLILEHESTDNVNNTPPQLNYWRVNYDGVIELALNADAHYEFFGDTINLGQMLDISVSLENISDYDTDSILVTYQISGPNQNSEFIVNDVEAPLPAWGSQNIGTTINTDQFSGLNYLTVTVNPASNALYYQREKFNFNNVIVIPFFVKGDNVNPLVDVTFDGIHILDGDIVSAQPEISIKIKDESEFLALNDTVIAKIDLTYPDGTVEEIVYQGSSDVEFIPADASNLANENVAEIILKRAFPQDGTYQLDIRGTDMAGNRAGDINYKIRFEVINQSMVSNLLNYPNPFSTSTSFVFTLTGSEIPDVFKIQIMTLSGKVVREIDKTELTKLHIGRNITDYKWDGTDQYGGQLGNGVYLYRVITRHENQSLDLYTNSELQVLDDQMHRSGFGKMYIMR